MTAAASGWGDRMGARSGLAADVGLVGLVDQVGAALSGSDQPDQKCGAEVANGMQFPVGEDEIRFFVQGAGTFYLHLGDEVVAVLCEAGDLLSVPALTTASLLW